MSWEDESLDSNHVEQDIDKYNDSKTHILMFPVLSLPSGVDDIMDTELGVLVTADHVAMAAINHKFQN